MAVWVVKERGEFSLVQVCRAANQVAIVVVVVGDAAEVAFGNDSLELPSAVPTERNRAVRFRSIIRNDEFDEILSRL